MVSILRSRFGKFAPFRSTAVTEILQFDAIGPFFPAVLLEDKLYTNDPQIIPQLKLDIQRAIDERANVC